MTVADSSACPVSDRELVASRLIEASRDRVFRAWIGELPQWWGPQSVATPVCELDLHPGGIFRTVLRTPAGTEPSTRGVFLEIVAPELIVFTEALDSGGEPRPEVFFTGIATFEEENGGTRVTVRVPHWTVAHRDQTEKIGFHRVWGESLDRLVAVVTKSLE